MKPLRLFCLIKLHLWRDDEATASRVYVHQGNKNNTFAPSADTTEAQTQICRWCGARRAWSASRGGWKRMKTRPKRD